MAQSIAPYGTGSRLGAPSASAIGRRMSGIDSCAIVAPSQNSTMLCTTDCGCTTTSMRSKPTPNSSCASITSSPLFISVELSMVILAPMFHVGCASASAIVTSRSCSRVRPRNGPPLAVSTMRADLRRAARRAGTARPRSARSRRGRSRPRPRRGPWPRPGPAAIRLSLFASASRLPGSQRGERRGQPGEADDRVEHDVGVGQRGQLGEHARARRRTPGPCRAGTPNSAAWRGEQLGVAARGERDDAVFVAVVRQARRAPACRSIRSTRGWQRRASCPRG